MRWLLLPLRLLGLLLLAALISGAWLFRRDLYRIVRPQIARVSEALGADHPGRPGTAELARARDKVDSLHGWSADSVLLTADEMASLVAAGLPSEARKQLDSLTLELGEGRVTVSARLSTRQIPAEALGPLAGALEPWEWVSAEGTVALASPGYAEWRVDALTLRGFTLPEETSRNFMARALPGIKEGVVPLTLPRGVAGLRIRPTGVALYRKERG